MSTWVGTLDSTQSSAAKLTTTNATAVYVNANKYPVKALALNICNTTAGAVVVTVAWYDSSATTAYAVLSGYSLAANTAVPGDLLRVFGDLLIGVGDEIRVTAGTINALEVIVTVAEIQSIGR